MSDFIEFLRSEFTTKGKDILYAALILISGVLISALTKRWLKPILDRSRVRQDLLLKSFFLRATSLFITILTILTALATIGFDVRTFIAGLGITGLIIGFGLRDILSNFAAGLLLLIYRPFRAGELIEVEGTHGTVEEMTIVNMQMTTTDGVRVIMPNSKVWGAKIINYSLSQRRRLEIIIKVREDEADNAINSILSTITSDPRSLKTPAPTVRITSITNDTATLTIWVWTLPADFTQFGTDAYMLLLNALRSDEIQIL
ncbi:MAG: mechanosensitive ion channel family protein [Blastocatellia bacterium]